MAKWPIDWHENNLKNFRHSYAQKQAEVDRAVGELVRWKAEIDFRQLQVDEAKRIGQNEFDPERFLKKRRASHAERDK